MSKFEEIISREFTGCEQQRLSEYFNNNLTTASVTERDGELISTSAQDYAEAMQYGYSDKLQKVYKNSEMQRCYIMAISCMGFSRYVELNRATRHDQET